MLSGKLKLILRQLLKPFLILFVKRTISNQLRELNEQELQSVNKPNASTYLKIIFGFSLILFLNFTVLAQNIQEKLITGNFQKTSLEQFFKTLGKEPITFVFTIKPNG